MYYTIYKITNIINNKIYIGQHITSDLNDSYFGSGVILRQAILKYGKENFKKEILFVFDNFDEMNKKEIELVNIDFVLNENTYNMILGGTGFQTKDTIVVRHLATGVLSRIHKEVYNKNLDIFEPESKGKIVVYDSVKNKNIRIDVNSFNPEIHSSCSKNKIVAKNNESFEISAIPSDEYYANPDKYTSVFGGIVAEKNGVNQYVSKDEYYANDELRVCSSGMVTAFDCIENKTRHVPISEFYKNRNRYKHNTEGFSTGTHKITGEKRRFFTDGDDIEDRKNYNFSTSGQMTVFSLIENCYKNVAVEEYELNKHMYKTSTSGKTVVFDITRPELKFHAIDSVNVNRSIHRLAKDKHLMIFKNGSKIFDFFGSKKYVFDILFNEFGIKLSKAKRIKFWNGEIDEILPGCQIIFNDWKLYYDLR